MYVPILQTQGGRVRHAVLREREDAMKTISTPNAPAAIGPYSQGKVAGGFLFASGQIALDPATGQLVGETVQDQARQALKNVGTLLEAAGATYANVVKATCFLDNMDDFAAFNEVYAHYFGEGLPARAAVGVEKLPKGALVEVEVIAYVGE